MCGLLASCVLCILFFAACVGMFLGNVFVCMYFHAQQPFAPQCQDWVSEVCLMEARSVQQSAAEAETLKFCLLHR